MHGRSLLDPVMDMPVYQDVLTGKGWVEGLLFGVVPSAVEPRAFATVARDERRVWITCRWPSLSVD